MNSETLVLYTLLKLVYGFASSRSLSGTKELERNNLYRSCSIFDLASRLGIFRIVWLCERFHNAEDGQKDKSDVKVVS